MCSTCYKSDQNAINGVKERQSPSCALIDHKELYAEQVKKDGFYLGILDLAMWAMDREKELFIIYHDDEYKDIPAVRPVDDICQDFVPAALSWGQRKSGDMGSKNTWVVSACKADFTKGGFRQLNHFVPVFTRQQMGALWDEVTVKSMQKLKKRHAAAQSRLNDLDMDDSDDEWRCSVQDQEQLLQRKLAFTDLRHSMQMHWGDVPADGNCALWSLMALEDGPVVLNQQSSTSDMILLRKASWHIMVVQ